MSDESKVPDLRVISTTPTIESLNAFAPAGDETNMPNLTSSAKNKGSTPSSGKKKRGRKASVQNNRPPSVGLDSEDINIHVEAGWSEDEADTKEHPAKRAATNVDKDAMAKKAAGALANFTVRAVVTRKDIGVVFGQDSDKQELLETQTGAKIEIISGKDDPDIVVDRVLSIKGPIDGVAAAYKGVLDSMRVANVASTASAATAAPASPSAQTISPSAETDDADKDTAPVDSTEQYVDTSASITDEATQDVLPAKEEAAGSNKATAGKPASSSSVTLRLLVPHRCVGSIMGHSGRTINSIRDVTSVSIHTSEATLPLSAERIVEINGTPESIQKAIVLVAEALTRDMASYTSAVHYVPAANLPSAMTVDIHSRKRKDGKRSGNADHYSGNRGQVGNRGSGVRNGGGSGSGNSGGYSQNRGQGGNSHSVSNNNMSGGMNNRGDRYGRYGDRPGDRHVDRHGGRNRGPSSTSQVNRVPVGGGSNNRSQGNPYNNNNNSGGYRMNNQLAPSRNAAPPTLNYGGYAVPAPTVYPTYIVPNAGAVGHMGGVAPPVMRYGNAMAPMAPGPARGAYGDSYNAAPSSYQHPAPAAYGYGVAPAAQGMYGGASEQSANGPYSQAYPERNNRPPMPQSSMPMRGNSGNMPMGGGGGSGGGVGPPASAASQTIQQIYVPGEKIGAVIGRRGETINEIRRSTSAHVDIQDSGPNAKQRLIVITGGYEQVRSAYYMIKNKVDMARPAVNP